MTYIEATSEFIKFIGIGLSIIIPIVLMILGLIFLLANVCIFAINRDNTRKTVIVAFNIMLSIITFILCGGWLVWTFKL